MWDFDENKPKKLPGIRVHSSDKGELALGNLTEEEQENIRCMVRNHFWVTVTDGRLEVIRRREDVPGPTEDTDMLPFWRRASPGNQQLQLFPVEMEKYIMPSIIIHAPCGYNYSPENYEIEAEKLTSYGFICLRSRRGEDARFWELWYLPSLWSAEGRLKEYLNLRVDQKGSIKKAVSFLCRNASFGSLDLAWQRAAMELE
ncbi:MAG: hypothetical protein WC848_05200 [Parcubacteria group bacterium]|jgi:hypothetical protein